MPRGYEHGPMHIGEGTGSQSLFIDVTNGQGSGTSFDINVGVEMELTAAGISVGFSAGFHYGYSYTIFTEETMFFEGEVGDIPYAYCSANKYACGLCAYPLEKEGQEFMVTNYWV